MTAIVVTGASGPVGSRAIAGLAQLVEKGEVASVLALDTDEGMLDRSTPYVEFVQVDLKSTDLCSVMGPRDTIIHLADEWSKPPRDAKISDSQSVTLLERVLTAADDIDCNHLVLLSSALVYGAYPDNPVPLTETHPARPIPTLGFAMTKFTMENKARLWAANRGARLAVMRPAATLSGEGASWIGAAIRVASTVRAEGIDPPIQFLHYDDLASALILAATDGFDGIYNVAPDGWIGNELFRGLRGEAHVRLPDRLSRWRHQLAKAMSSGGVLDGLEPYVTNPWVVANDKLRAAGWEPSYTNAEAYVMGTPPPLPSLIAPQRRQELALGVLGLAGAAAAGGLAWSVRRMTR